MSWMDIIPWTQHTSLIQNGEHIREVVDSPDSDVFVLFEGRSHFLCNFLIFVRIPA